MDAFGSLDDMLDARVNLSRCAGEVETREQ